MMRLILALVIFVASTFAQQVPCGFSCSRRTVLTTSIDGVQSTASCSEGANPSRCSGCCIAKGLQSGLDATSVSGFISNDNRFCVCCFNRSNNCGGFNTFSLQ